MRIVEAKYEGGIGVYRLRFWTKLLVGHGVKGGRVRNEFAGVCA